MSVGEFCNRQVVIANRDCSIVEVAQLMRHYHVGDVVIVEDKDASHRVPVGIITDRDITIELIAQEVALDTVTAGDVMSFELATARETDTIWDTMQTMRGRRIRRVVVINAKGGLEGILTVDDLIEMFAEQISTLAKVAISQQAMERKTRI